jgi:hypothetical protein
LSLRGRRRRAVGVAGFALFAALPASCRKPAATDDRAATTAAATPPAASAGDAAATLVAQARHDFGHVAQGATLRHVFATRNRTNAAIRVENTLEVLGCAGVAQPDALAPGEAGELHVTCRASIHGPLRVSLPLRANGRPAGELSLVATVEPLVAFDRALLDMNVAFGEAGETVARLRGKLARSARLSLASAPPPGMDVRVLPAADGGTQGTLLRLSRPAAGVHAGTLRFLTGLAEPEVVELPYSVRVTGTLVVSPTNPVLDLAAPGGARAIVRVTSAQPGFEVERAEVLEGPFSAHVRQEGAAFAVELSLVVAKFPPGAHGVNGRVRIVSNDRTEPMREIPLFALGTPTRASPAPSR